MSVSQMSPYERKAWDASIKRLNRHRESRVRRAVGAASAPFAKAGSNAWGNMPGHERLEQQVPKALEGMKAATFDPALRSVDASKVLRRHGVGSGHALRSLDLADLDRSMPGVRTFYTATALTEGGASALAVTGAEVSSTVSGGVTMGVAAGAIAVDVTTSMAIMGRIIGRVAAEYGYDVRVPEEEAFALGVISLGAATTAGEKAAALGMLRRLTQQMMRQATWEQLNKHALVKLIQRVYVQLGERLTKRKLAQAVPVAGVFINAGLSAQMADGTYRNARDVYRLRFLSEKYGIDPDDWAEDADPAYDDNDLVLTAAKEVGVDD